MRDLARDSVTVNSAGTKPGNALNALAVDALTELGIDTTDEYSKPLTDEVLNSVDVVIVLRTEAKLEAPATWAYYSLVPGVLDDVTGILARL